MVTFVEVSIETLFLKYASEMVSSYSPTSNCVCYSFAILKNIVHQEIELLPEHFNELEPKDRLELLVKLLPFALPKVVANNL